MTAAFLAVVLGPVLLGSLFVGATMTAVDQDRSTERLRLAATAVRTSIHAVCQQLRAAADAVALTVGPAGRSGAAVPVVARGLATAVRVTDASGRPVVLTPAAPAQPWTDCAGPGPGVGGVRALAARVELRDPSGARVGTVAAAQPVDPAFVARLAAVSGVAVTLLDGDTVPASVTHTTESVGSRDAVVAAADSAGVDRVTETSGGRYVRRVGPSPGQPLPLVLSVPGTRSAGQYGALLGAVVLAALVACVVAWRLAGATTRPLAELAGAVEQVTRGDLTVRVPVRNRNEIGQLASAFNRMTRETQTYVAALTSSRDQLRGHLAVLGDTLASTHDRQGILRVILHSAITVTGARGGLVLLVEAGGGMLVGQCAEGLDERWPASGEPTALRVPVGSGVIGLVAATGEPQRGRTEQGAWLAGEPGCTTYVAVPVSVPAAATAAGPSAGPIGGPTGGLSTSGQEPERMAAALAPTAGDPVAPGVSGVLGVLVLYDRLGAEEFDDDDVATLRTFASHVGVAVENVRMHEEAQRLSLTDPLTGLWNRRYLRESLRREVERASRFGRMLSVLALDLDRFKAINDGYGHAAGDAVLAEFARRVRKEVREVDLAFRSGGEEFVVLLPETDARGAATVAERLGAAIRESPFLVERSFGATRPGPVPIPVTVSVGVAVYPDHAATGQQVLDAADDALYQAKASGRDTYRLATPAPAAPAALTGGDGFRAGNGADSGGFRADNGAGSGEVRGDNGADSGCSRVDNGAASGAGAGNGAATGPRNGAGPGPRPADGGASSGPHPPRQSRGR